jgi:hypothetical protein
VGELVLVAVGDGAQLTLEPLERRTRAFQLDQPPRLVIDVAAPDDEPFDAPADVRALRRDAEIATSPMPSAEPGEPGPPASDPPSIVPADPGIVPPDPEVEVQAEAPVETPAAAELVIPATQESIQNPASPPAEPVVAPVPAAPERRSWLRSQALLVPLLAGAGVLLLAAGGLALASAQRRPRRREEVQPFAGDSIDVTGTRLDLLEKRLEDEVRARSQLEEQVAQTRTEVGALRDLLARLRSQAAARAAAPSAPQ